MNKIKTMNFKIVIPVMILFVLSLITLAGIIPQLEEYGKIGNPLVFLLKQFTGIVAGSIAAYFLYITDMDRMLKYIDWAYWVLFGMLFILFSDLPVIGNIFIENINGANGWFNIPIVGITIQPVEFMKIAIIFKLAAVSTHHFQSLDTDRVLIKKYIIYGLIPVIMVLLQPDLGGALLLTFPLVFMFLVSLKNKKYLKICLITMIVSSLIFVALLLFPAGLKFLVNRTPIEMYQLERLNAWLYPFDYDKGLQLKQSLVLMGSSGLFGHGFGYAGIYLPEPHTDVIFSEFVGMFGMIAGTFLIGIYFYLINQFLKISINTNEVLYKMVALGFSALFFIQVTENIGMMLGLLPITGIVLPFMSYGVSAMITYCCMIGILLNIDRRIHK